MKNKTPANKVDNTIQPQLTDDISHKGFDPQITKRLIGYSLPYFWPIMFSLVLMLI